MTTLLILAATTISTLYQNDFTTRTSAEPLGAAWSVYKYDKGGPVAYDYQATDKFQYYYGPYPDGSDGKTFSQQDGWFKARIHGNTNYDRNRGRTTISTDENPSLVFSDKNGVNGLDATNHAALVYHPLRNVFSNGVLKVQFDIRQPGGSTASALYSWLRLVYRKYANPNSQVDASQYFPFELGLSSDGFSGGWRKAGDDDNKRTFNYFSRTASRYPTGLGWYRYCVTCDLDASTFAFDLYELGSAPIPMDQVPYAAPVVSMANLQFVKTLDANMGGVAAVGIRTACCDTLGYYGEASCNNDYCYRYDNIKVSWKAPSSGNFVDCYRNDFSASRRRTIDGSATTEFTYPTVADNAPADQTFTYATSMVRASTDFSATGKPGLTAYWDTTLPVQRAGIDGWRIGQAGSGYKGVFALTTEGSNRVGLFTKNMMVIQPMCADVTNGVTKFEYDFRMPKGWNGGTKRSQLALISNKGYAEENNFMNNFTLLTVAPGSTDGKTATGLSLTTSKKDYVVGDYHAGWSGKFTALNWYRVRIFIDLDAAKYWFEIYELGDKAPADPDAVTLGDPVVSQDKTDLCDPSDATKSPIKKYGKAIGAYGFTSWNDPSLDKDYAIYVDNIRFWKQNGEDWDIVFKNDFSTSVRYGVTRKEYRLNKSGYNDRPQDDVDNWTSVAPNNGAMFVAGTNTVLDSGKNALALVQPLGRSIRNGKMTAQFDVRVPDYWPESADKSKEYFWFQLGGGALASASTWKTRAYHDIESRAIRIGMQLGYSGSNPLTDDFGIRNKTALISSSLNANGSSIKTGATHVNATCVGHWIRMRIEADMDRKIWDGYVYDMGTAHPTLDTPDGTQLNTGSNFTGNWQDLRFTSDEPITHLQIIGGYNPSHSPWRDDLPGAVLVDNIKVCHDKQGLYIHVR